MNDREKFEQWWKEQPLSIRSDETFKWHAEYGFKAAIAIRKPYGYGILNKDGGVGTGILYENREGAQEHTDQWNQNDKLLIPYRVAQLFYEEQS